MLAGPSVVVVQVAPYNVQSIHASNYGSAGPGMEVAKNATDDVDDLLSLCDLRLRSPNGSS